MLAEWKNSCEVGLSYDEAALAGVYFSSPRFKGRLFRVWPVVRGRAREYTSLATLALGASAFAPLSAHT